MFFFFQEEEEERSDRWNIFLERVSEESVQLPVNGVTVDAVDNNEGHRTAEADANHQASDEDVGGTDTPNSENSVENGEQKPEVPTVEAKKIHKVQIWSDIRPSLRTIEGMMSVRVKKRNHFSRKGQDTDSHKTLKTNEEAKSFKGAPEDDSEEEFYDVERSDPAQDVPSVDSTASPAIASIFEGTSLDSSSPWKEELEVLVRGGLPMALRGEVCNLIRLLLFDIHLLYLINSLFNLNNCSFGKPLLVLRHAG